MGWLGRFSGKKLACSSVMGFPYVQFLFYSYFHMCTHVNLHVCSSLDYLNKIFQTLLQPHTICWVLSRLILISLFSKI